MTPNLYGNLVANTAAGIAGGTGVMPGGNQSTFSNLFYSIFSLSRFGKPYVGVEWSITISFLP